MEEKKLYHHKDLKNALIEKGIELVSTNGVQSFSLRKVAAACGVSHAAPYSHFQNIEELLNAMQNHVTNQFSERLEHTIATYRNEPNILEHLGKDYVMFFVKNPHYYSFLYTQSNIQIDLSSHADSTQNYRPFEIYKKLVLSVMEQSNYPKEKQKDTLIALWSLIQGITSLATMKNVTYDENWEHKIVDLLSVFHCTFLESMHHIEKQGGDENDRNLF